MATGSNNDNSTKGYTVTFDGWTLTLIDPIPQDDEGWRRVKLSEAMVRYALERLTHEPKEVTLARWAKYEREREETTFLDLIDDDLSSYKAKQTDRTYLELLYSCAADEPTQALAKYLGLPSGVVESLPRSWLEDFDDLAYEGLVRGVRYETSDSASYRHVVEVILEGALGDKDWLKRAERPFRRYLDEQKTWAVVDLPGSLVAPVFRGLEQVRPSLADMLIPFGSEGPPLRKEREWSLIRAETNTPERYRRLIEAAVLGLGRSLWEDFRKIARQFAKRERDDEYQSYGRGRGDFAAKLSSRIDKDRLFHRSVKKDEDRLNYALRRGGYRTPDIREAVAAVEGKALRDAAMRKRYERTRRMLEEENAWQMSQ